MELNLEKNRVYKVTIEGCDKTMASVCKLAAVFSSRLKGLMFRSNMDDNEALLIYPCNSVHTFFMRFSIDLIFIDPDGIILSEIRQVRPGKALKPIKGAWGTLELKGGRLDNIGLNGSVAGKKLRFEAV